MIWYIAWAMIILIISVLMSGAFFLSGFRSREERVAGSVARAKAAKVSMIRLTQSSWTAVRTDDSELDATAETKVMTTAVILTLMTS